MKHLYHSFKIAIGMMGRQKALTGPLWVQIGISNPCNHRCVMCWDHPAFLSDAGPEDSGEQQNATSLSVEADKNNSRFMEIDMLKDLVKDLKSLGTGRVELAGRGEPTLHPEFEYIVEFLKANDFNVGIVTNASLLTREKYEHLVRIGVDRLVISLNAATAQMYPNIHTTAKPETFEQIVNNLRDLSEMKRKLGKTKPGVMLSFVICRPNYEQGLEMIELGKDVGADQIVFKYAIPHPKAQSVELNQEQKKQFSSLLPEYINRAELYGIDLKIEPPIGDTTGDQGIYSKKTESIYSKIPCYIGWVFALITAEGFVIPCCQCNMTNGDLREQSFREIWNSKKYNSFRKLMKSFPKHGSKPDTCQCDDCSFEKINTTIYNTMHFYKPVCIYEGQRDFTLKQLLPAIIKGKTTRGAKSRTK